MAAMKLDFRVPKEIRKRKMKFSGAEGDKEEKNEKFYGVLQLIGVSIHMQILDVNTQGAWHIILNTMHSNCT